MKYVEFSEDDDLEYGGGPGEGEAPRWDEEGWAAPQTDTAMPDDLVRYTPKSIIEELAREQTAKPRQYVFGYARYSSPQQRASSIERQKDAIRHYARSRGLTIDRIFTDEAITGTASGLRVGLSELMTTCAIHPGSIVLVENLDRLSRDMPEYGRIKHVFGQSGTVVHDSAGENTPLVEAVKAGVASEDRIRLLDRTSVGRIAAAKEGKWVTCRIPYGYRRTAPGTIEADENTSPNVVLIFELRSKGLNFRQISDELISRGVMPPISKSGSWSSASLRVILTNEVYVGWCKWNLTRPVGHQ